MNSGYNKEWVYTVHSVCDIFNPGTLHTVNITDKCCEECIRAVLRLYWLAVLTSDLTLSMQITQHSPDANSPQLINFIPR